MLMKFIDIGRDMFINRLLSHFNLNNGLLIYSIITTNPLDVCVAILCSKLGVSKIIITLIIAFLL